MASTYRRLDGELVVATVARLRQRIAERFPDSGLRGVARELESLASRARETASRLSAPIWPLRIVVGLAGLLLFGAVVWRSSVTPGGAVRGRARRCCSRPSSPASRT